MARRFDRRTILRLLGLTSAAGLASWLLPGAARKVRGAPAARAAQAPGTSRRPPNFVFILSDDHRADFLAAAGHPFIQTPNLDRLAREGVRFENAFITTSLCSPSRGSYLTGMYASRHGCRNNLMTIDRSKPTFPERLAAAGWRCAVIGKWHMPGPLPTLAGVDPFITFTINTGQGRYFDCPLVVNGREVPARARYVDEDLTDYGLEFLERARGGPFCLYLAFKAPHHDWQALPQFAKLYADAEVPASARANPWLGFTDGNAFLGTVRFLPALYRDYCRSITSADFLVGRVLERLDALGLRDDTVVIYASDNGYLWGEHRLVDKRWAYEDSIRIPLIVRHPPSIPDPGRRAPQMVLNVDVAPTLLDLAGLAIPADVQGASFAPILRAPAAPGRAAWLYEHFPDYPYPVPPIHAVRTADHKYIEYGGLRPPELFDLVRDPGETRNLIGTPEGERLRPDLAAALARLARELAIRRDA